MLKSQNCSHEEFDFTHEPLLQRLALQVPKVELVLSYKFNCEQEAMQTRLSESQVRLPDKDQGAIFAILEYHSSINSGVSMDVTYCRLACIPLALGMVRHLIDP